MAGRRRAERGVGGLADFPMAEVVGAGAPRTNDAPAPQLVEAPHEALLAGAAGIGEDLDRELPADRRRHPGQLGSRLGQASQA